MTSGNNTPNKFENSGLTATKSEKIDAPIINEFPICMECELLEEEVNWGIVGKVVNTLVEEDVMTNGNVDINQLEAIAFDPYTRGV